MKDIAPFMCCVFSSWAGHSLSDSTMLQNSLILCTRALPLRSSGENSKADRMAREVLIVRSKGMAPNAYV